ncbi:hypothetical protein [Streptomyces sp. NPDC059819]|uniref:hypothetical protein n=1 Tax=Streptomyces sp. NPDC059819 TaxID=3346963 RepID=UPI00364A574B
MTKEEWIKRELAKAPERDDEWVRAMLGRFGIFPEDEAHETPAPSVIAAVRDGGGRLPADAPQGTEGV